MCSNIGKIGNNGNIGNTVNRKIFNRNKFSKLAESMKIQHKNK